MNRFLIALVIFCLSNSAFAIPCEFEFENTALSRISNDSALKPLANEWLRLNEKVEPTDENFLKVTYWYLVFVAIRLNKRQDPNADQLNNPYVTFLKDLFAAKERGIDVTNAIAAISDFLDEFITVDSKDREQIGKMAEAIQRDLVPQMARLQIDLAIARDRDRK